MYLPYIYRKTSQDEDVITLAKNLIKAWKKFLPDNSGSNSSGSAEKERKVRIIHELQRLLRVSLAIL